jgi:NADPH:quinone reductase-like Zn-dependent oxidoreductase
MTWDVIFDVVVKKTSFTQARKVMNKKGVYLTVAGGLTDMLYMVWTSLVVGKKVKFGGGSDSEIKSNLEFIASLIREGEIRPVLDKTFEFNDLVQAHHYVESGQKKREY